MNGIQVQVLDKDTRSQFAPSEPNTPSVSAEERRHNNRLGFNSG